MKTTVKLQPRSTLEEFADKHGLEMEVRERPEYLNPDYVFYAQFKGVEVLEGRILASAYGEGNTPEEAIAAYAQEISEKHIVIDAYKTSRREIFAPIIGEQK